MHELLAVHHLDLHKNPVRIRRAFILPDGKRLTTLGRPLVDNAEFSRRMLFEKIPEHKFRLSLAKRLYLIINRYIDGLVQVFGQFLGTTRFNGLFYLIDHITLGKGNGKPETEEEKDEK